MTDGRQQPQQPQGPDEQPRPPKPGQPTLPFRALKRPPSADQQQPQQPQSGYGYPQQQPQQPGYGYPQQQPGQPQQQGNGPAWTPPASSLAQGAFPQTPSAARPAGEPDWSALAERTEAGNRKRKMLLTGGGVLAAAAVAGIVATAVVLTGHHSSPGPQNSASPAQPSPSFSDVTPPPPPDPLAILSSAKKDTAPLSVDGLFPGKQLTMEGRQYAKAATSTTTTCYEATAGGLGDVLAANGCRQVIRATYSSGGAAVTVGVAVFDTKAAADKAKNQSQGYIQPLSGAGVPTFCHATACRLTANSVGRYAYFTIAGYTNGQAVTGGDTAAQQAGSDVAAFAFNRIVQRGRDEAATASAG